ncbi:MAG: FKBP-type peptidyl-prolyl cis-trans isomerase [Gemmatimonadota bacterium]|nr:FKBP-type peptidyl-prolyl cis-trans isomerase [Gemmatimonadota bacterium]
MSRTHAVRPLAILLAVLMVASCGPAAFEPNIEKTQFADSLGVDLANSTRTARGLWYRDITVGGGAQVPNDTGTTVTVRYVGYLRNGVQFDAGTLAPFKTGSGALILGFDEGVRGMRVGGRRQLIVPPSLGYGDVQQGSIPPSSILVFVVDLLALTPPA